MTASGARPFPLVPRHRFLGVAFGRRRTARRGDGDEIAGTRPYRPGDLPAHIHWSASARLSEARGTDEFVVREFFAERAPRVALVCDRRPAMALNPPPSPWLDKRAAVEAAALLVGASAGAERGDLAYVDADARELLWLRAPARSLAALANRLRRPFDAPAGSLQPALEALLRRAGSFPTGSFVFVLSDFLEPVGARVWTRLRAYHWEVVPVIVQDTTWEQSFPRLGAVPLPLADPATGRARDVWMTAREAHARAEANERRLEDLLVRFRRLGFDPVVLDTSDPLLIGARFHAWAERRRRLRRALR
jgi:uncharacterized protein (DUF58 family)